MITSNTSQTSPFSRDSSMENTRLNSALAAAGIGSWELDLETCQFWLCERFKGLVRYSGDAMAAYQQVLNLVHPSDRVLLDTALQNAILGQPNGILDVNVRALPVHGCDVVWLNWKGQVRYNPEGILSGFSGIIQDVTKIVQDKQHFLQTETQLRSLLDNTPDVITRWDKNLRLIFANKAFEEKTGMAIPSMLGKTNIEIGQPHHIAVPYMATIQKTLDSRKPQQHYNSFLTPKGEVFFYSRLVPELDPDGQVTSVLAIARDITELKASEYRIWTMIEQAPMAIAFLNGRDMVIDFGNDRIFEVWGKDKSIIGQYLLDALPEIKEQGFMRLLQNVFDTGVPYFGNGYMASLLRGDSMQNVYFDFVYTPLRDVHQVITGVMVLANEVTQQVQATQKIQEAESTLRCAVELAELGTWCIDLENGQLDYSRRLKSWYGLQEDEPIVLDKVYTIIAEQDRGKVKDAFKDAIAKGSNGILDLEYGLKLTENRSERILHARGKTFFNEKGTAYKMIGSVQEVTTQRRVQNELEQLIKQRTMALDVANEELSAINEEYLTANEELAHTNKLLMQSNENLRQFAYVASHDLQEPLRKIIAFGNMLHSLIQQPEGKAADYLNRMQASARRMTTLIDELLSLSQVSSGEVQAVPVDLNEIISQVLTDLELVIQQTDAVIEVSGMPTIKGDPVQLGQLFQNLISNALKFRRPGVIPHIKIKWDIIKQSNLPAGIKPAGISRIYDRITVSDNGIGFDEKHKARIFEAFQRLHGKNEYAGTGIGLAICEKVVANHRGAIHVASEVGSGSTFSIYIPVTG